MTEIYNTQLKDIEKAMSDLIGQFEKGLGALGVVMGLSLRGKNEMLVLLHARLQMSCALKLARKQFMKEHRTVFAVLGIMQYFWYSSDKRRERFVKMCDDPDVQTLTWDAYMNKRLVRKKPLAHAKIFFKDMAHLMGMAA